MELTSPEFDRQAMIPTRCTCDGEDLSPELHWRDVPDQTVELALTCEDPDAPSGTFVHWILWGLEPSEGSLGLGTVPATARQGRNDFGRTGYGGPCPPPDHGPHRYRFTLHAVSAPLDLAEGATIDDLRAAVAGRVLGTAELVGTYAR